MKSNTMSYDLSVLVITYNQQDTVRETLDSILAQEHEYSYEIVVCDDCSTDTTADILYDYQARYPDIVKVFVQKKNLGVIKNYYAAFGKTSGKILMQCAGDDYWLPGKVALQMRIMQDAGIAMCYSSSLVLDRATGKLKKERYGRYLSGLGKLLQHNSIPAPSVCIRRDLVCAYVDDIQPESRDWLMEDYPLWLWLAGKYRFHFISEPTTVYRFSLSSISRSGDFSRIERFEQSVLSVQLFFSERYGLSIPDSDFQNLMVRRLMKLALFYRNRRQYLFYFDRQPVISRKARVKRLLLSRAVLFFVYSRFFFSR